MLYGILADLVVLFHAAFVIFVFAGGLFFLRWKKAAWVHLPCAAWGAFIEFTGFICPLTPLENHLRRLGGEAGYEGGFVEHYVIPVLYPESLTTTIQIVLGIGVVLINVLLYGYALHRWAKKPAPREKSRQTD